MSVFNATALIVDDRDVNVQYSPGWQQQSTTAEYDDTKSGADQAGMTATFQFTGTAIEVYGSLGSWDVYGVPVSSYVIDGGDEATYTAPIIAPGFFEARILFYRSPPLDPGAHTLVITNKNGTKPCVYWLDYFVYTPVVTTSLPPSNPPTTQANTPTTRESPSTSPTHVVPPPTSPSLQQSSTQQSTAFAQSATSLSLAPISQSDAASSSLISSSANLATSNGGFSTDASLATASIADTASQLTASATPSQSVTAVAAAASATRNHASTGAIVGSVIGGVAILAFLLVALIFRRRRVRQCVGEDLSPFALGPGGSTDVPASQSSHNIGSSYTLPTGNEKFKNPRNVVSGSFFTSPNEFLSADPFADSTSQPLRDGLSSTYPAPGEAESDRLSHSDSSTPSPEASTPASSSTDPRTMILAKLRDMRQARDDASGTSSPPLMRQHEDSGMRMLPRPEQHIIDIPPAYSTN